MNELYNDSSSGYAGNDDCGEMSAWYVFGALGFYPVNPVSGKYIIGTPMLEEAVIRCLMERLLPLRPHAKSTMRFISVP